MSEYRIVKRDDSKTAMHGDVYIVQRKVLFVWLDVLNCWERPMEFRTVEHAEETIKEWGRKDVVVATGLKR